MDNLLTLSFPLNEAQWKTAARCHTNGTYGYLRLCESLLLQQLVNYFNDEVEDPINYMPSRACEMAHEVMVEVAFIYKSLNAWYSELVDEMPDDGIEAE